MSYASDHPVRCCHAPECTASFPGSKHDAIKASAAGWFFSRAEADEHGSPRPYCPEHVPDWVPAWRARWLAAEGAP